MSLNSEELHTGHLLSDSKVMRHPLGQRTESVSFGLTAEFWFVVTRTL